MKRYIAVCTPEALKFKESRRRALARELQEFVPKKLSSKSVFTETKAA